MNINKISLLKSKRFLPLFLTQSLTAFNDNVFKNALVGLITFKISSIAAAKAQLLITIAAGLFILPFFLFSAMAGQFADKYEKSILIRVTKLIEVILMGLATIGFFYSNLYVLFAVLFLLGIQATFFGPLKYSILPEQLSDKELLLGNSLVEAGTFISILIGTIVGGVVITTNSGLILTSAIIFVIAMLGWLSSRRIPNSHIQNSELLIHYNFITETKNIIYYVAKRSELFLCILGISWFWLVGATFLAEMPVFVKENLHANQNVVAFFISIFCLGLAAGSMACNQLLKNRIQTTYVPLGVIGITIFIADLIWHVHGSAGLTGMLSGLSAFVVNTSNWRIIFDLFMVAFCGGIYTVPLYAMLQTKSEKSHVSRVIACNNIMNSLFMVVSALMTVLMLKLGCSILDVYLIVGLCNAIVAFYIMRLLPRELVRSLFRIVLKALFSVEVNGLENYYRASKRAIIIANHTSFLDALVVAVFLPDDFIFAVDTVTAKRWWVKPFVSLVNAFPVSSGDPMSIKSIINAVKQEKRCIIFPEGRLTRTGSLMKVYEGPGMIADKSDAEIISLRIDGAQYSLFSRMRGKVKRRLLPKITLTILPAKKIDVAKNIKGAKRRYMLGKAVYDMMVDMIFATSDINKTLFSSLLEAKEIHSGGFSVINDINNKSMDYRQLITRSFAFGRALNREMGSVSNVGILLPNMVTTVTTFFALQAYDYVPAMLNYSSGISNIIKACDTAKIKTVITSTQFLEKAKLNSLKDELCDQGIHVICLEDFVNQMTFFDKLFGMISIGMPKLIYRLSRRNKTDAANFPAVILFTSGTEGDAKGVVLSHRNLQANRHQLSSRIDFTEKDCIFNALPLFHSFGLSSGLLLPVLSGVNVFLYPTPLHYRIIPKIAYDINATILFGTDIFLSAYAKTAHPYDFYSIRYVFSGAEKLKAETKTLWAEKFGIRIFEGYGATEAAPVISMNTPMYSLSGSVGQMVPGMEYRLEDVTGVSDGKRLHVKGPNVMKGYIRSSNPGILEAINDGWYDTGDIVDINADGFIFIKGRVKRFAKVAGEMISLAMVEDYIKTIWPEDQHVIISLPDDKKGERLVLVTTSADANREAIVKHVRNQQLPELSIPKSITHMTKLPLLGSGKVDYKQIEINII